MKVALLGNASSVHMRRWAENIGARGVDVAVFSPVEPGWDSHWVGMPLQWPSIPGIGLGTWRAGRWLAKQCRERGVDIVHAHYAGGMAHAAHSSGVHPFVITVWGSDVLRLAEAKPRSVARTREALGAADLVTCGSLHLRSAAVAAGARSETCRLVGWGVDTTDFAPDARARERVRRELGITPGSTVVLSTRHLSPLYRVASIIEAFSVAAVRRPDLELVVLDDGPDRAELEALAQLCCGAKRVRFVGHVERMPEVLAAGDIVVSVPLSDGAPMSLMEAMAVGLPVVGSELAPYREWIEPGRTGALWSGDDIETLADAIVSVAHNAAEQGAAGQREVRSRAERSEQFDRVVALYSALVAGAPLPADPAL